MAIIAVDTSTWKLFAFHMPSDLRTCHVDIIYDDSDRCIGDVLATGDCLGTETRPSLRALGGLLGQS